jgi:hypothetical protein
MRASELKRQFRNGEIDVFTEMLRKWAKPFGYHPKDSISFMARLGYRCHAVGPAAPTPLNTMTDESVETNFVFLHGQRHAALAANVEA